MIEVTIGPDGTTTVEVNGVAGPSCKQLTNQLEKAPGVTTSEKKKPEWHQQATQKLQQKQR